jgi:NTP pyrophosphatase (non-canonical NTP hydrolase)
MLINIIDQVGEPAALEQLAEECCELAQAALKLARCERGENPTPKSKNECVQAVLSEVADVFTCIRIISKMDWYDSGEVYSTATFKEARWLERLEGDEDAADQ